MHTSGVGMEGEGGRTSEADSPLSAEPDVGLNAGPIPGP